MVPDVGFVALGEADIGPRPERFDVARVCCSLAAAFCGAGLRECRADGDVATWDRGLRADRARPCAKAIALARAGHEAEVAGATRIVVDDTCPPPALCDRLYPFDSIVVFVTGGADTTGWYAFHVFGLKDNVPTKAARWPTEPPAHIVQRLRELDPIP